jgi:hypothetical protein
LSGTPVEVQGVEGAGTLTDAKAITAGEADTCVIIGAGNVDCWGFGGGVEGSTPVPVKGVGGSGTLAGAQALAAGQGFTCALVSGGGVDCWGENGRGEFGDGSTESSSTPVAVPAFGPTPATLPSTGTAEAGYHAIVKRGKVGLRLTCRGSGACKGSVKLIARVSKRLTVKIDGKPHVVRRTREFVIGTANFSLAHGTAETLRVSLTAKGKELLRRAGKKGLRVSLIGKDIKARSVLLKAP